MSDLLGAAPWVPQAAFNQLWGLRVVLSLYITPQWAYSSYGRSSIQFNQHLVGQAPTLQKTPIHTDESSLCLHSRSPWSNQNTDTWEVEQHDDKEPGLRIKNSGWDPAKFAFMISGREWDKGDLEKEESGNVSAGM